MPEYREPFFTPDELKRFVVFRPRQWRAWWSTEPVITKVFVGALAALGAYGWYDAAHGGTGSGWAILAVIFGLVVFLLLYVALLQTLVATFRWVFRTTGIAAWWKKNRRDVLAVVKFSFWAGVVLLILIGTWPYLSTDPVKSWYALKASVPVERVEMSKRPHDCEFETAPLGSKHCHYQSSAEVFNQDGNKWVLVTYTKVED